MVRYSIPGKHVFVRFKAGIFLWYHIVLACSEIIKRRAYLAEESSLLYCWRNKECIPILPNYTFVVYVAKITDKPLSPIESKFLQGSGQPCLAQAA